MTQFRTGVGPTKSSLRESALMARRSIDAERVGSLSSRIHDSLLDLPDFTGARVLECYVAMKDEVQTEKIIRDSLRKGVRVLVPLVAASRNELIFSELRDLAELAPSKFGILEPRTNSLRPTALDEAEAILVPLVAWDDRGFRIGYGKGYFDRALASVRPGVPTIGLGFELQHVERIPNERHDVPLKMLVTESRVLRFGGSGDNGREGFRPGGLPRGTLRTTEAMLLNGTSRMVTG